METLTSILGFGASVASGGIFGAVGAIAGSIGKFFHARQEFAQEKERRAWDREDFELQMKFNAQETEGEIAVASAEGAWTGLSESIKSDRALSRDTSPWANNIKSLFRPFLTTLLVCITAWIIWLMWIALIDKQGNILVVFSEAEIGEILKYSIYSVVFSATTSVVWWFGDRALAPPGMKNR